MKDLKLENAGRGLCVVCGSGIFTASPLRMECKKCHHICKPTNLEAIGYGGKNTVIMDIKSDCCNADVRFLGSITCSLVCHQELVIAAERDFGTFKKVVDETTDRAYKVPTRDIIEKGLTWADLVKYPAWED